MTSVRRRQPWIAVFVLVTVVPIVAGLVFMATYASGGIGLLSHGWTDAYWLRVLGDARTWSSLGYSFAVGLVSLLVSILVALGALAALGPWAMRRPLSSLWFVPLTAPPLVAAIISVEMFGNAGWLARVAHALGWIQSPVDFPDVLFTASGLGIIVTHVALVAPFLVLLFGRLERHLRLDALARVAHTLGASRMQVWTRVRIPALLRTAEPTLTVYGLVLVGAFEIPLLVGAQSPSMISVLIERQFAHFDITTKPEAYALATLYALIAMSLLLAWFGWRGTRRMQGHGA
ncbi:hypothetical protein [Oleiagrimonas sp.]|jgi:putative spermidine/putrescine transport system permease protein|uniref:hypothetical protein n=1 Tax=Oleiagrimonas sp. TaxID=2010330 RepID=UPI002605F85D|nr:hypothetical protein [Oleiagrimonas sp.]MDA3914071.1 hypothetical protein [Oleiagrimonas sp.]